MSSEKTKMECLECGKIFYKKIHPHTFEVRCPKCGGYDTDCPSSLGQICYESFEEHFSVVGEEDLDY